MRKKLWIAIMAVVLSAGLVLPNNYAYADETTAAQEETAAETEQQTDKKETQEEKPQETKKEQKDPETAKAPDPTEPAETKAPETKPPAETESAETKTASSSVMPIVTGYLFDDGSFDVWVRGSGLYVGDGQIVIPTRLSYSTYPNGEGYAAIIKEKADNYSVLEIDTSKVDLTTAIVLPNGEWEKCTFIKSNDALSLCLMSFQDAGLKLSVPEYSREAWPDTVYVTGYQGSGMDLIVDDLQAGTTIRSSKAITMECDKDIYTTSEEQVGSVITNGEGYVIGVVTRHSTDKASLVKVGDILRLMENKEPVEVETTTQPPEYDDGTDKILLQTIEELEKKIGEYKDTDYESYTKDTADTLKSAIEKAEADLRTATPDQEALSEDIAAIEKAASELAVKEEKKGGSGVLFLILVILVIIAILAGIIMVPIILFKPKKQDGKQTEKNGEKKQNSKFMVTLAKLLGVKLKNMPASKEEQKEPVEERHKTGDLKKDGYGGELARAMYEAEQEQKKTDGTGKEKDVQTESPASEKSPKNVALGKTGTSVLKKATRKSSGNGKKAWLVDKEGKKTEITSAEFWIGREQMAVDYCIAGNDTIGRRHAVIRTDGESFTIEDNGSVNKTYLNGVEIQKGTPVKLTNHDTLTLSDETLIFIDREE